MHAVARGEWGLVMPPGSWSPIRIDQGRGGGGVVLLPLSVA